MTDARVRPELNLKSQPRHQEVKKVQHKNVESYEEQEKEKRKLQVCVCV